MMKIQFQKILPHLHPRRVRHLPLAHALRSGRQVQLQLANHSLLLAWNNMVRQMPPGRGFES